MMRFLYALVLTLWAGTLVACEYTVGVVPQFEMRRIHAVWTPILDQFETATGCTFGLIGAKDIPEFEMKFMAGLYDFAYMNPFHSVMAFDAQQYVPLVRSGDKKLQGILVAAQGSDISTVQDLDGATLAFPSPNALGASLLMRAELTQKHGVQITPKYVKTHSSVYLHVFKGLTQAGGGVARTLRAQEEDLKAGLKVIYKTDPVFAHPFVAHPRVPNEIMDQITKTFTGFPADLVKGIPMKRPVPTGLHDYESLRKMGLGDFVGK